MTYVSRPFLNHSMKLLNMKRHARAVERIIIYLKRKRQRRLVRKFLWPKEKNYRRRIIMLMLIMLMLRKSLLLSLVTRPLAGERKRRKGAKHSIVKSVIMTLYIHITISIQHRRFLVVMLIDVTGRRR